MAEPAPRLDPKPTGPRDRGPTGGAGRRLVVLSKGEVRALLKATGDDLEAKALVTFVYFSACRYSEAVGLKVQDFDWPNGRVCFYQRKVAKWNTQAVHPQMETTIRAWLLRRGPWGVGPVFTGYRYVRKIQRLLVRLVQDSGIARHKAGCNVKDYGVHGVLRHSRAVHMLEDGASVKAVQTHLNHAREATTADTYLAHISPDWVSEAHLRSGL